MGDGIGERKGERRREGWRERQIRKVVLVVHTMIVWLCLLPTDFLQPFFMLAGGCSAMEREGES